MIKPRLKPIQLTSQRISCRINRCLKRPGLLLGEQFLTRDFNSNFNGFVFYAFIVQSKEYFAACKSVVKRMQFVKFLLNEANQFAVGIEVNGMNA